MTAALSAVNSMRPTVDQQNALVLDRYRRYMDLRELARTSKINRAGQLASLASFLEPTPLIDATYADLLRWAETLLHFAPKTRYAKISIAHCFYTWAHLEGYIDSTPTLRIPRPKFTVGLPRPIPEIRLRTALENAQRDIRLWLILAAYAGLRCCEIATLTRDHVLDASEPPVLIVRGKGKRERIVPMCNRVVEEIERYGMPDRGSLWLPGRSRFGRPPSANRVSQLGNSWLHSQGVPDTMHSLRHRFATEVTRATGDIQTTATLLGHADLKNTMIYAAFSDKRTYAAVLSLDDDEEPPAAS